MDNFQFTPEQLTALQSVLDFSTPKTLLESIDFIANNIGREGMELPECLQRDAFGDYYQVQWHFEDRTHVELKDLTSDRIQELVVYVDKAQKDPEGETWEHDYKLDRALRIMGTPRLWLCEQLITEGCTWDDKVKQMLNNIEVVDVIERHARKLEQRISDLSELSTKAMRERMSWSKRTAQDLMNQAKHFEAKMLKGYELTLDDKRQLKSLIDCLGYTDTHGMQWDRRKAVDRLINEQVGTTLRTALTWLEKLDIEERQEDAIVAKLVELQNEGEKVKQYTLDNGVLATAVEGVLGELRKVTAVMTQAGWSRESIQDDIASAKQALSDLVQVRDLFIDRLSDEAKDELNKVSIEDIISQLDALAGVLPQSNQETAEA
jgi:hypothetical protein